MITHWYGGKYRVHYWVFGSLYVTTVPETGNKNSRYSLEIKDLSFDPYKNKNIKKFNPKPATEEELRLLIKSFFEAYRRRDERSFKTGGSLEKIDPKDLHGKVAYI